MPRADDSIDFKVKFFAENIFNSPNYSDHTFS
jgi:hypothetical protein